MVQYHIRIKAQSIRTYESQTRGNLGQSRHKLIWTLLVHSSQVTCQGHVMGGAKVRALFPVFLWSLSASGFIVWRGRLSSSLVSLQTLPDAHWPGLVKVASAGLTNAVASSVSLQTPPDAHGPGLIKVASAEPSPIKAPVIHHSHSISTSAKPKTVAQGRSLPTNLPPLVALDLYLTNIIGIATNASQCARAGTCQGRFIRPHQRRCYHPSAQGPELVKVTIHPHAHTRPITPLDPSAPSTNHSASPMHVLTSRCCRNLFLTVQAVRIKQAQLAIGHSGFNKGFKQARNIRESRGSGACNNRI
ncbi:hypothetical protein EDB83DRAFT_2316224 [Lactarius deliciosus]|nr:hypothetical protein EDB83DRAFT_2316224 [Lactarius deliciosus]